MIGTGAGIGSGHPTIITESFDRSVSGMDISANGKTVFITAHDAGRSRVFSVPSKGGTVKALDTDSRGVYSPVYRSQAEQLVARWASSAVPAEVIRINASNGQHTPSEPVQLGARRTTRPPGIHRVLVREFERAPGS